MLTQITLCDCDFLPAAFITDGRICCNLSNQKRLAYVYVLKYSNIDTLFEGDKNKRFQLGRNYP